MAKPKAFGTIYWAQLKKPSKFGYYELDLVVDKDEAKKILEIASKHKESSKDRLPEIKKDERGLYVKFRRKAFNAEGEPLQPPLVVDKHKKPLPENILIGNGSKGYVAFDPYRYSNKFGKGVILSLSAVMVTDLVEYQGSDPFDDIEVEEDESEEKEEHDDELPF